MILSEFFLLSFRLFGPFSLVFPVFPVRLVHGPHL